MNAAAKVLAAAFRKVAAQLPGLRSAHREFSETRQGQLEAALSSFEQKVWDCEQAAGAQAPPQFGALRDAMQAVAAAARVARSQEVSGLVERVLTLLDGRELSSAFEATAPTSDPDTVCQITLHCKDLTVGEIQALYIGLQFGQRLAAGDAVTGAEVTLPHELTTSELQRAIENHRRAQMPGHLVLNS